MHYHYPAIQMHYRANSQRHIFIMTLTFSMYCSTGREILFCRSTFLICFTSIWKSYNTLPEPLRSAGIGRDRSLIRSHGHRVRWKSKEGEQVCSPHEKNARQQINITLFYRSKLYLCMTWHQTENFRLLIWQLMAWKRGKGNSWK